MRTPFWRDRRFLNPNLPNKQIQHAAQCPNCDDYLTISVIGGAATATEPMRGV